MKKKSFAAIIASLIILCIASGAIYLRKTYVKIEGHIYKTDGHYYKIPQERHFIPYR